MNNPMCDKRTRLVKVFFLIQFLAASVRIEAATYSTIDYEKHPVRGQVVLVVSEAQPDLRGCRSALSSQVATRNASFSVVDFSTRHKYALHYYNNRLRVHFKSIQSTFIPHSPLFCVRYNTHPADQSNDSTPPLLQ
jgi:hypothetical protein